MVINTIIRGGKIMSNISVEKQKLQRTHDRITEFSEIAYLLRDFDNLSDKDLKNAQSKLGVTISKLFVWSPSLIATAFYNAMEDSNAHSFNEDLEKLLEKHQLLQD
jgi:hypothetical protein